MNETMTYKKWDISLLYVEDDAITMLSVSEMLRRRVRILYTARDGKEGLELFKLHEPDIIVTDIKMPAMDGLAMSNAITAINKDSKIIVLTGYSDRTCYNRSLDLGITQYVLKPMDVEALFRAIDTAYELIKEEKESQHLSQVH